MSPDNGTALTVTNVSRRLWNNAKELLFAELGDSDRKLFEEYAKSSVDSPNDARDALKETAELDGKEYTTPDISVSSKRVSFGRILQRLNLFCSMVESGMSFAPEMARMVWTTVRVLSRPMLKDQELCEFLQEAVDCMTDTVFVCNLYAHRYGGAQDTIIDAGNPQNTEREEVGRRALSKIPSLYKLALKFSFKAHKRFPQDNGRFSDKLSSTPSAAFGNTSTMRAIIVDARAQLDDLGRLVDFDFQEMVNRYVSKAYLHLDRLQKDMQDFSKNRGALGDRIESGVQQVGRLAEPEKQRKLDEKYDEIKKWLQEGTGLPEAHFNSINGKIIRQRSINTCQWIFKNSEYTHWLNAEKEEERVLWLSGRAGAGKSFISSAVVERLETTEICVYFFCKIGNDSTQMGERIILHLLLQIYAKAQALQPNTTTEPRSIKQACIDIVMKTKEANYYPKEVSRLDITEKADMIACIANALGERRVYIVVDALDECVDWQRFEMPKLLKRLASNPNVRVLISCRLDNAIGTALGMLTFGCHVRVSRHVNEGDIETFLKQELGLDPKDDTLFPLMSRHALNKICKGILRNCDGMFQYAAMAVNSVKGYKGSATISKAIKRLPLEMNGLYAQHFVELDGDSRAALTVILRRLMCEKEGPRAEQILDDLDEMDDGDDTDDSSNDGGSSDNDSNRGDGGYICLSRGRAAAVVREVLNGLRSFVAYDPVTMVFSLQHNSIKDWITSMGEAPRFVSECPDCRGNESTSLSGLEITPKYGHLILAQNHLRRLRSSNWSRQKHNERWRNDELLGWHVQRAEAEWEENERSNETRWWQLYDDLEKYMVKECTWNGRPETLVHEAAWRGFLGILQRQAVMGGDFEASDHIGNTPLHYACRSNSDHYLGVKPVLDHIQGSDVINRRNIDGETPLLCLLKNMALDNAVNVQPVRLLLENGASASIPDSDGQTCLHHAIKTGSVAVVREILKAPGIDINAQDSGGFTPLSLVLNMERTCSIPGCLIDGIVPVLFEHGADYRAKNGKNESLFQIVFTHPAIGRVARRIISCILGAMQDLYGEMLHLLTEVDDMGQTLLHRNADSGYFHTAKQLCELELFCASRRQEDCILGSSLAIPENGGTSDVCRGVSIKGAVPLRQLMVQDATGKTPVQLIFQKSRETPSLGMRVKRWQMISLLLDYGDPKLQLEREFAATMLRAAILDGRSEIYEQLAYLAGEIDEDGWMPLMWAEACHERGAIKLFSGQPTGTAKSSAHVCFEIEYEAPRGTRHIRTAYPVPFNVDRFYFEATLRPDAIKHSWNDLAIGWHSQYRASSVIQRRADRRTEELLADLEPNETVGTMIDRAHDVVHYMRHGRIFTSLGGTKGKIFPRISADFCHEVSINFGTEPFMWKDWETYVYL